MNKPAFVRERITEHIRYGDTPCFTNIAPRGRNVLHAGTVIKYLIKEAIN